VIFYIVAVHVIVLYANVSIFSFLFKQKTAYEIPKRDWSSDVCSSDLFSCLCEKLDALNCESNHTWVEVDQLSAYPMPDANNALIQIIQSKLGVL